jgi:hypothetical protein
MEGVMTTMITLDLPDDVSFRATTLAESLGFSIEEVLLNHLKTLDPLHALSPELRHELDALQYLSDDALWTIAREQLPTPIQARAQELLDKNSRATISDSEHQELEALVERGDQLMLRKAEAAHLLSKRGYHFQQSDFADGK